MSYDIRSGAKNRIQAAIVDLPIDAIEKPH